MRAILERKGEHMKNKSLKFWFILVWSAIIVLSACSAQERGDVRNCQPGTQQACTCDNGLSGTQVCATSGQKWGNCVCTVEHPDNGTAKDTGVDTKISDPGQVVDTIQDLTMATDVAEDVHVNDMSDVDTTGISDIENPDIQDDAWRDQQ